MKTTTYDKNVFNTPEKGDAMESLDSEHRWASRNNFSQLFRVAVIFVLGAETKNQAWRRHVREHPADQNADIKIFNFAIS